MFYLWTALYIICIGLNIYCSVYVGMFTFQNLVVILVCIIMILHYCIKHLKHLKKENKI
jgi:hypothetical protein